jgi:hypothetical protein
MKGTLISFGLLGIVAALPQFGGGDTGASTLDVIGTGKPIPPGSNLLSTIASLKDSKGTLDGGFGPQVRNEVLDSSPCGNIIFIFARASMEPTNMVRSLMNHKGIYKRSRN